MAVRLKAGIAIAAALCAALSLGACSTSTGDFEIDPAYWFPDGKKKLPGERREVFPGGVPGVTQGVPPELIKGSPQQQAAQNAENAAQQPPEPPQPEPKAAQKSKPKKAARPAPPPADPDAEDAPPPAQPQRQARPAPQQQQQQAPANSAWPAPPPASGTFTR